MTKTTVNLQAINDVKEFVNIVMKYDFDIDLVSGRYAVDAKSIMGIFSLDLSKPIDLSKLQDIMIKYLPAGICEISDGASEDNDDDDERQADFVQQKVHVEDHLRALILHLSGVQAVHDHPVQFRKFELGIVHHNEGRDAQ